MRAVAEDIRTVGWSVSAVLGDEIAPPWALSLIHISEPTRPY